MRKTLSYISIAITAALPFATSAASFDHDLYIGVSNKAEVTMVQQFLRDQGLYNGPVTGNFFSLTKKAVMAFQEKEGIVPAQGYFGPKTRAQANLLLGTIAPSREEQIALLQAQIQKLKDQLALLITQQQATTTLSSPSPTPSVSPSPSPSPLPSSSPTPTPIPTPVAELRISGNTTQSFPNTAVSPLKLGDITIKNTTDHAILFNQFQLDIYDAMNSSLNRNKTVLFKLRNGTTTANDLISETQFTINREPPPTGTEANRRQLNVSFPITVKAGETKMTSLWIENLDYVVSGYLRIEMLTAYISDSITPQGGFTFLLTK